MALLPDTARVSAGGRLSIGRVDMVELAAEVGTPAFVYDEEHLRARCREAVSAFGAGATYATKAFLCKAMARLAHEEGMRLDVATGGEMGVALAAGVPASRLVFHGNNKSVAELEEAIAAGVGRIVVDSFDEIERLERLAPAAARSVPVMVRVTPGIEAHTHEYIRTGQLDSKFGFGIASGAAAEAVARLRRAEGVALVGVHAHIGSQIFAASSFASEVEVLSGFFNPLGLEELCVGGGLGVAYVTGEQAPTITEWAETVYDACRASGVPEGATVTAEPGRAIVASAAVTLYTIGTRKDLPGLRSYVAVDGGLSDNPRPVLYGSGYEAMLAGRAGATRRGGFRVVGKHCESGDIVVADATLPEDARVGEVLVTPVTGAYGHSMASNYNKVARPPVVFVRDGSARTVVRRETLPDLLATDLG
ncbi:MAG: diaminopimelate decarboxylase [Acidimicrobiales bacterium]